MTSRVSASAHPGCRRRGLEGWIEFGHGEGKRWALQVEKGWVVVEQARGRLGFGVSVDAEETERSDLVG